jgi:hypothetical protein
VERRVKRLDYGEKPCGFRMGQYEPCGKSSMGFMKFAGGHEAYLCEAHYWPLYRKYFVIVLSPQQLAQLQVSGYQRASR